MDPWNTSALYQLGVVRQRYGDWKEAMRYYRRVYEIDPGFENAALYSNQLARQHADSLNFSAYTLADTSRLAYHGEGSVRASLTSFLGIDIAFTVDSIKNYKVFGEEQQSSYLVQSLSTGLPVSLFSNRLILSPKAGVSLFSRIYDNTFLLEGDRLLSLPEFLGEYEIAPLLGFSVTASFDPLYASGTYRFGRYEESYNPERDIVNAHNGEASIQVSLGSIKVPVLRTLTFRTYGRTRFLHTLKSGDRNFIGTVSQDIMSNIHLADSPWTTLILGGNLVFEHSKQEEPVNYYTPIGVLVTKGSAGVSSWISLGKENVLGVYLQSGAGVYIDHLGYEDMERSLQLEASTRVDFQRSNSSFYLSMNGSATFSDFPETRYWSLFATIGFTTSLPRLLAE